MKITIADVAREAGVAKSTVSKVLNTTLGIIPISRETRHRVRKAAQELNYYPSGSAGALSRNHCNNIGLFCGSGVSPYLSPSISLALEAINATLLAKDYNLMILLNSESTISGEPWSFPRMLREKHVDGLIIAYSVNSRVLEFLHQRNVPLVFLEAQIQEQSDCVWPDDFQGAMTAVKYLFSLGHRRIIFVERKEDPHISQKKRHSGYLAAMNELKLEPAIYDISQVVLEKLLSFSDKSQPTAIVANHDEIATRILQMAYQDGISVPKKLSVLGITNTRASTITCPPLTVINVPMKEMGTKAAEMIVEKVKNNNAPLPSVVFEEELVVRGSTAPR